MKRVPVFPFGLTLTSSLRSRRGEKQQHTQTKQKTKIQSKTKQKLKEETSNAMEQLENRTVAFKIV